MPIELFGRHRPPWIAAAVVVADDEDRTLPMALIGYFDWKKNFPAVSMILSLHELVRWLGRSNIDPLQRGVLSTTLDYSDDDKLNIAYF